MEEAAEADYVVIIDDGKISAEGTPVSYTHLDVYKRQVQYLIFSIIQVTYKLEHITNNIKNCK